MPVCPIFASRNVGQNLKSATWIVRVLDVAFSPDGTRLATGSRRDNSVRIWSVAELYATPAAAHRETRLETPQTPFPGGRSRGVMRGRCTKCGWAQGRGFAL